MDKIITLLLLIFIGGVTASAIFTGIFLPLVQPWLKRK